MVSLQECKVTCKYTEYHGYCEAILVHAKVAQSTSALYSGDSVPYASFYHAGASACTAGAKFLLTVQKWSD